MCACAGFVFVLERKNTASGPVTLVSDFPAQFFVILLCSFFSVRRIIVPDFEIMSGSYPLRIRGHVYPVLRTLSLSSIFQFPVHNNYG
jgi:hypothetical protein